MSEANNIEGARKSALDRVDRTERQHKITFFGAAVIEAAFLLSFLLLADFSNRTHLLLLIATIAIYTILALGLVALGSHANRNTLRILRAIELLEKGEKAEIRERVKRGKGERDCASASPFPLTRLTLYPFPRLTLSLSSLHLVSPLHYVLSSS